MENDQKIRRITKVLIVFLVLFILWTAYTLSKAKKEVCPEVTTTTVTTTTTTETVTTTTEAIICPAALQNTPEKPGYKCILITSDEKTYSAWCEKEAGYFGIVTQ